MKLEETKSFRQFLRAMLRIGAIGFGGGSALIPVIEREIVDKQKLDEKANIDKDVIVASITPGALPVEVAAAIGSRGFGKKGMVGGAVMIALPGTLLSILLVTILSVFQEQIISIVNIVSLLVSVYIIYLLFSYLRNILKEYGADSKKRKYKTLLLMLGVYALSFWFSTIQVLAAAFLAVFFIGGYHKKDTGKDRHGCGKQPQRANWHQIFTDVGAWLCFFLLLTLPAVFAHRAALPFIGEGVLSAWASFGGGDAYLTIADGFFVANGAVTQQQYYSHIVPVVNMLPGSILCKTLSAVGYYIGWNLSGSAGISLLFALAGFGCSVAASCSFFMVVHHLYDYFIKMRFFQVVRRWIRPIIGGLLIKVMVTLCYQNILLLQGLF